MRPRRNKVGLGGAALLAILALPGGAALAQVQGGQTTAAPPVGRSPFCIRAEQLYAELLAIPAGTKKPTDAMTFSIYRNMAAARFLTLAWAGKCDLGPYLTYEERHMKDVTSVAPGGAERASR